MKPIQLKNVSKKYKDGFFKKDNIVLNSVTFSISKGKTFGIVGKSGSGKSTLAKIIVGLLKPDSGEVLINSEKLRGIGENKMQIVFQNPKSSLNPKMNVKQILIEPLIIAKHPKVEIEKKLIEILADLHLDKEILTRYTHMLSGGQQQVIAIGRAIISKPKILILDEPLSSLDILTQNKIIKILKKLKDKFNFTYIFISHDLHVAKYFCDEIAVINNGVIVEQGSGVEVIGSPKNSITKELVASIPKIGDWGRS